MKNHLAAVLALATAACCFGAEVDRWRGLALDETTPDQATAVLGKPKKDETKPIRVWGRAKKVLNLGSEVFQVLEFRGVQDFKSAELAFRGGKLVLIDLEPEKGNTIPTDDLEKVYPAVVFGPPDFGSLGPSPGGYAPSYYILGSSEAGHVSASVLVGVLESRLPGLSAARAGIPDTVDQPIS